MAEERLPRGLVPRSPTRSAIGSTGSSRITTKVTNIWAMKVRMVSVKRRSSSASIVTFGFMRVI